MSFWTHLKPAPRTVRLLEHRTDDGALFLRFDDGVARRLEPLTLRRACPCAECIDEWTGKRLLDDASLPTDLRFSSIDEVGHYALGMAFSDGHRTGLYTHALLHTLAREGAAS